MGDGGGASDGVGAAFAGELADRGLNVVLLARRQQVLEEVAAEIARRTSVQNPNARSRSAGAGAAARVVDATDDLDIGFLVYCAGADRTSGRSSPARSVPRESMIQRNCVVPVQLVTTSPVRWRRGRAES